MSSRTIHWPPRLTNGRVSMTTDPSTPGGDRGEALRQVVRLRHGGGRSLNPWNEAEGLLGLESPTFDPLSVGSSSRMQLRSREHFAALEAGRRARLVTLRVNDDDATRNVVITYEDLEQDTREALEVGSA